MGVITLVCRQIGSTTEQGTTYRAVPNNADEGLDGFTKFGTGFSFLNNNRERDLPHIIREDSIAGVSTLTLLHPRPRLNLMAKEPETVDENFHNNIALFDSYFVVDGGSFE